MVVVVMVELVVTLGSYLNLPELFADTVLNMT